MLLLTQMCFIKSICSFFHFCAQRRFVWHGFSVCAGALSYPGAAPLQGFLGAGRVLFALSAVTPSAPSAEAAEELELVSAAAGKLPAPSLAFGGVYVVLWLF